MTTWSEDAEEGVLGAMMLHATAKSEAAEAGLRAQDFYRPTNANIYRLLEQEESQLNPIIVIDMLEKAGTLPDSAYKPKIMSMTQNACLVSQVRRYASIIRNHAALRRLANAGLTIQKLAETEEGEIGERLSKAEDIITEVVQESAGGQIDRLAPAMLPSLKLLGANSRAGVGVTWVSTGFRKLDDIIMGLRPGKLVVLAARPSVGKSTLAVNMMQSVAAAGTPSALFSLEMGTEEIGNKILASLAELDYKRLVDLRQPLSEMDLKRLQKAYPKLDALPIFISDDGNVDMANVRARARALKRTENLGLLVIDYLQLMVSGESDNRNNEVAAISRAMKLLARELRIPILLLSQLNRASEKRQEKSPMLSDLRDSGAIEQDADQVIFIHRPELYEGPNSDKKGVTELSVAKNRDGELGWVNLTFVGRKSRFLEVASARDDAPAEEEAKAFGVS